VTLSSIGDAVITTDTEAKVTFLNPVAEALTGWKSGDASGQWVATVFHIINEETRQSVRNPIEKVLREGVTVGLANHTTLIAKDGTEIPIEDSAAPIRDARGNILGAVMVFHDVTQRRQTERVLQQSEARQQLAMEAGQMGAWEWIIEAGKVIWSPTLEAIHGLPPGAFGGTFDDFSRDIHPQDRERVLAKVQESIERRGDYRNEYRIIRPDGALCWIEARGKIFVDDHGDPERMAGICLDITERRNLEEVQSRLAAVVEFSDDAIVSKTLEGIITTWNHGAQRVFGYAASEVIGKPVTILIPENRLNEESEILARVRAGVGIEPYETIRRRKDGRLLNVSLTVSPIKDARGTIIGASKIARDITQRKQAEAENARLYQELQQANAAKDHFIAVLSHELRTPLNPVLMIVTDLERDETVAPAIREQLTVVRRNVELEALLVDDLLDSTRIASGKLQLHRTVVDATELVRRAVAIVEGDASDKGVAIEVAAWARPCPVDVDPARVQQAIWNVIKNAVKFTAARGWVRVGYETGPTGQIRIKVQDNGIGIEPEHLETIFNAFEQGDTRTGHCFGGLGLGLTISKALVTLHGGSLVAQSEGRGHGATFIIELPLATQASTTIHSEPDPFSPRLPLRLLVVEDHQATSDVMVRLLKKRGYSVSVASSIQEALSVLSETPVDLLISDVGLPDGSGRDLMETIRKTQDLPGIALSGYGTEADLAQSCAVGFSLHLTKPVDIDRLDFEIQSLATERGR
ncbi:MAG: PAS domain S-box protein, partial [Opitutaceae bacterium]|nr:PAS domain S-box protein [Verrucomicrobiales bacterium]